MYAGFYHLNTDPFCLNPDPRFRFSHPSYSKARAYLLYALQRAEGFVVISGAPGTGKSTLIKEMMNELYDTNFTIAKLVSTQLNANDLLQSIAYSLGIVGEDKNKASLLRHLEVHLAEQYGRQRRTLLIVDEAQDLPKTALEELRLLTNLERNNQPLLQVFLVGQKQLFDVLQLRVMEQLKQRIIAACEILPLPYPEVERYVFHRLQIAGWKQDPVMDHSIFPHLYHFSNGVPRKINQIMSRLLLHGFVENKHVLTAGDISEIINELKSEKLSLSPLPPVGDDDSNELRNPLFTVYNNRNH
ncbi:MAG: AAA family ATPase [Gammaproteobacteria bacterium]|jgi:type II secretory pathway predicted ATPase ExeA